MSQSSSRIVPQPPAPPGAPPPARPHPSPPPLTARLGFRLTAAVVAVVAPVLAVLVWVGLRAQERHLIEESVRAAALLSDTIKNSTHLDMLADRRAHAYSIMQIIGEQPGIERVRIFNKEGLITFSTAPEETGRAVDKRAESCYACHAADQPLVRLAVPSRSRVYQAASGHRVLGMVTPIYNEASCSEADCHAHPTSRRVLGVVDVGVSLELSDAGMASLRRRSLAAGGLGFAVLAIGVTALARRTVVEPVGELLEGTRRIAAGELEHVIPETPAGELGQLAASFNRMSRSLQEIQRERDALLASLEQQVDDRTAALRDAQAQLVQAEKLASLGRLAASIAHEINNPLAGILTFAKLIVRTLGDGELDEPGRQRCLEQLHLVERETERCTAIVRNLLDFARQRPLQIGDVDLLAVVNEALSLVGHQLSLKGVEVETHLSAVPVVRADFGQIRQALVNVCLNGADAMPDGGRLEVTAGPGEPGREVLVEVRDHGVGIPQEHLDQIFDPFFSTKTKGTGLGLSVVYGIVERHNGRLEVDSEPGHGTSVRIILPVPGTSGEAPVEARS